MRARSDGGGDDRVRRFASLRDFEICLLRSASRIATDNYEGFGVTTVSIRGEVGIRGWMRCKEVIVSRTFGGM